MPALGSNCMKNFSRVKAAMKISILLRGNNFLEKDRFGFRMDARDNAPSLLENLIGPVRAKYPDAKVYLATYNSAALEDLKAAFAPCEVILIDANGGTQLETYKRGLQHIYENDDCDAVIVTRFDINFIKSFDDWGVQIDNATVYIPWREWLVGWRDHHRVGDAVHIIGREVMGDFYSGIIMSQLAKRADLHLLYYFLRLLTGNIRFIDHGFWDSNPMFSSPESHNPLYTIFNRPRLPGPAPNIGRMPTEIKAE